MTTDDLLARIQQRLGAVNGEDTRRITFAVLASLGERLSKLESEALADDLPPEWAEELRRGTHDEKMDAAELRRRVATRASLREGQAQEAVAVVLQTLAEAVGEQIAERTRGELPDEVGKLLARRDIPQNAPPHLHPEKRTLAEGRAPSSHPLHDASADRAQADSVASTDAPHADTKLSSAQGLTQEREGHTLATGRPGSDTPLSEGEE